jgi:NAD(P)H dehydrogenase (quinone)
MATSLRVGVLTGSSASGLACIKKLLSSSSDINNIIVRGCFRTADRAQQVQESLMANNNNNMSLFESHVGVDAEDVDSLRSAFQDCDRVFAVTPLDHAAGIGQDAAKSKNMIQAAMDCGVKRVVHVGSWTIHYPSALPLLSPRFVPTETFLKDVVGDQLEWTVLRGGYFMSNLSQAHGESIRSKGSMLPTPDVKIPMVDVRDIGEAAAALLSTSGDDYSRYHKQFIECCGPELLSHDQMAVAISSATGKTVAWSPFPGDIDAWCNVVKNPIADELFRHMVAHGGDKGIPSDSSMFASVLGRKPRTLRDHVADHREHFAA